MIQNIARSLNRLLNQPVKVLWFCVAFALASLLFDGSFLHLWSLHREQARLGDKIQESKVKLGQLEFQIHESQQPEFIERQARDQFDLVKEGDLVFVFSDDGEDVSGPESQAAVAF
jgi:cell division protein FtsB